jgi:hypothetical protein
LHTYLMYFLPGMWWHLHTIRMTLMLHCSHGLQLCCSHWHNAWQCFWFPPSVSNCSKPLELFRVRVLTGTESWQRGLPHNNPDCCYWAGFTTKNAACLLHNYGSN